MGPSEKVDLGGSRLDQPCSLEEANCILAIQAITCIDLPSYCWKHALPSLHRRRRHVTLLHFLDTKLARSAVANLD